MRVTVAATALWAVCGSMTPARSQTFTPTVRYDTAPRPLGVLDGRIVVEYTGMPTRRSEGLDTVSHGLRLFDIADGGVIEVRGGIPDLVMRAWRENASTMQYEGIEGDRVVVVARGQTMVRGVYGGRALTALDPSGRTIANRELDSDLARLSIDADGRIWAHTSAIDADGKPGIIVLSRDLSEELFRVAAMYVMDASGDFVLAMGQGRVRTRPMVLLKMRPADPTR